MCVMIKNGYPTPCDPIWTFPQNKVRTDSQSISPDKTEFFTHSLSSDTTWWWYSIHLPFTSCEMRRRVWRLEVGVERSCVHHVLHLVTRTWNVWMDEQMMGGTGEFRSPSSFTTIPPPPLLSVSTWSSNVWLNLTLTDDSQHKYISHREDDFQASEDEREDRQRDGNLRRWNEFLWFNGKNRKEFTSCQENILIQGAVAEEELNFLFWSSLPLILSSHHSS